jgi:hypothetical protein
MTKKTTPEVDLNAIREAITLAARENPESHASERTPARDGGIEVFYLVAWIGEKMLNPLDLARNFAESYSRHPAGAAHRLTLIISGSEDRALTTELRSLFGASPPSVIYVPDVGYDIGKYRAALESSDLELCCILNSYSTIRASGWLAEFSQSARDPRVGIVGATGSYESRWAEAFAGLGQRRGLRVLRGVPGALKRWAAYPPFPNPHIRTNAFMIRRDVFQRVEWPRNPSRMGALRFESGRRSLTRQVLAMGLDAVIVGRDGRRYGVSEWPLSSTFRQNGQHNLLVADNRTIQYSTGAPEFKRQLAAAAWGSDSSE